MKSQTTTAMGVKELSASHEFSTMERYVLRRFHPVSVAIDTIGSIWCVFYLWEGYWQAALYSILVTRIISVISVRHVNPKAMASTIWGRIALLHINPANLSLQTVGAIGLLWSVWTHSTENILAATSVILLGHLFGWREVDNRMAMSEKQNPYFQ